jgi:AcrR family transcriptional regulator
MATVNSYTGRVPTPSKVTIDDIVTAGRALLDSEGIAGLTMQAVAQRVGVRAPSLYKHVVDRDDLVRLVAEAELASLSELMADGRGDLRSIATAFRSFAHAHPAGYLLVFSAESRLDVARLEAAVSPLLDACAAIAGPEHALEAARTLTAWATGFITMELAGQFNLGGDVDDAWEFGVERLTEAIRGSR